MSNTYESFIEWFLAFHARHKSFCPNDLERWFYSVEDCHKGIRSKLGGVSKQEFFKLESSQGEASPKDVYPIADQILSYVPTYLRDYGFDKSIFLKPSFQQGTHNVFKLGKHLRTYASGMVNRDSIPEIEKHLSKLGAIWAKSRTSEIELECTVSTSAKGFALLGHYKPDKDSCFRNGSDKPTHKFVLGQSEETFVITVAGKHPKKREEWTNVARSFGCLSNEGKTLNFTNHYLVPGTSEGDIIEVYRRMSELILGGKVEFDENMFIINGPGEINNGIYQNEYDRWSFTLGEKLKQHQILYPRRDGIQLATCTTCGAQAKNEAAMRKVDGQLTCTRCAAKALRCEATGTLTFQSLSPMINAAGQEIMACAGHVEELNHCDHCGLPSEIIMHNEGSQYCPACTETHFDECDECHQLVKSSEICDDGDRVICNHCVDNGATIFEIEKYA